MRFIPGARRGLFALAGTLLAAVALAPMAAAQVAAPTLSCGTATQDSIQIQVCANGRPDATAYRLQWVTLDQYNQTGFTTYCEEVFSDPQYLVTGTQCVTVTPTDPTCQTTFACGTSYVFRVAYVDSKDISLVTCSTSACNNGCTLTQGYWKNHPESWPVGSLTLGTVTYTEAQLLQILGAPVKGNGLVSLAHQLIAAKLNVAAGADDAAVATAIADADALIGGLVVPPIGSGYLAPKTTSGLNGALDAYNSGVSGPGHCD